MTQVQVAIQVFNEVMSHNPQCYNAFYKTFWFVVQAHYPRYFASQTKLDNLYSLVFNQYCLPEV